MLGGLGLPGADFAEVTLGWILSWSWILSCNFAPNGRGVPQIRYWYMANEECFLFLLLDLVVLLFPLCRKALLRALQ